MKKLIIFILLLFSMFSIGFSTTDDAKVYWAFDDSSGFLLDSSGHNDSLVNSGMTSTTGKINQGALDDGTHYFNSGSNLGEGYSALSVGGWFNPSSVSGYHTIVSNYKASNDRAFMIRLTDDEVYCGVFNSANTGFADTTSTLNLQINTWYYVMLVYDGTTMKCYIDNSEVMSVSANGVLDSTSVNLYIGKNGGGQNFVGILDEIVIYDNAKSTTELTELYNSGDGYNPYSASPSTIIFNLQEYYNSSTITITLNSTTNTNMSYTLDSGTETTICNDCNLTDLTLNSLIDGLHNIKFISNDVNGEQNSSGSFTIDTTLPIINIFNTSEINSYFIDWTNHFNYSDTNFDTCQVTTQGMRTNCSTYVYDANGNQSVSIYVNDSAGNENRANYTQLVNPYQYLHFQNNVTSAAITNYNINFNGIDYSQSTEEFRFKLFDVGYGSWDVKFWKYGFYNTTIPLVLNSTSNYNLTSKIKPVTISIQMYDVTDLHQLTFDVVILNSSTSISLTNQTNFSKTYDNMPVGNIEVIVSTSGYDDTKFYYNVNPFTALSIIGYLTPSNLTEIYTFTLQDTTTSAYIEGVIVEVQKLINGTYTTLVQKKTSGSGLVYFNLDPSQEYKVIFSKSNYVSAVATTIPLTKTYTVKLAQTSTAFEYIDSLSYSITPVSTTLETNTTYSFGAFISDTSFTSTAFSLKYGNGTEIYSSSSLNPSGTTYNYNYKIPATTNQTNIIITLTYIKDGVTKHITKTYDIHTILAGSFIETFQKYGSNTDEDSTIIRWLIMMMIIATILIFGSFIGSPQLNLLIMPVILFLTYINWLDWITGATVLFVAGVLYLGGRR